MRVLTTIAMEAKRKARAPFLELRLGKTRKKYMAKAEPGREIE